MTAPAKAAPMREDVTQAQKYRKTALIEASQWFKDGDHPAVKMSNDVTGATCENPLPFLDTLEGGNIVHPGDWIATGVKGEHWCIKPDVFAATYEPVNQVMQPGEWLVAGSDGQVSRIGHNVFAATYEPANEVMPFGDAIDPNASHNHRHIARHRLAHTARPDSPNCNCVAAGVAHIDACFTARPDAGDEDVERVARAIYEEDDPWHKAWEWPNLNPEAQGGQGAVEKYRDIARAALAAMRFGGDATPTVCPCDPDDPNNPA